MSSFDKDDFGSRSSAAEDVRKAFAALSVDEKISTLIRVELDMLGDLVDAVVSGASRMVDEVADTFKGSGPADTPSANL